MTEAASTSTAPTPVMDVVAPPVEKKTDASEEADPLDKLAADDQKTQQILASKPAGKATASKKDQAAKKPKHEVTAHSSGVGLAITATVIIVLGLAALATYAYLQTNK